MRKYYFIIAMAISGQFFPCFQVAKASQNNSGKNCLLNCHKELKIKIMQVKAHDPVQKGDCVICHNPHTSNYRGLLAEKEKKLCYYTCHKKDKADSFSRSNIHTPLRDGKCIVCHDPHYSPDENLLIKTGSDLCFECHSKESMYSQKEIHPLVKKGDCNRCHDPHSSDEYALLRYPVNDLCGECHNTNEKEFVDAHFEYPMGNSDCTSCHAPHSSDRKNLLRSYLHQSVLNNKCDDCHNSSDSEYPLALKNSGVNLCYGCHEETKKDFEKINTHMTGNMENPCLNCHDPHASDSKSLLNADQEKICFRKCHTDSKDLLSSKFLKFKHPNYINKNCTSCHSAHGSDYPFFLVANEDMICSTGDCHQNTSGFTHPIGPDTLDPRNNKAMSCITCHNPMGAGFKYNLRLNPDKELCEQCHKI